MPKISVIIPVYNVEKYLPRCIESVLNQTFTDFEVICINDASPDNCAIILERYASLDKRVQIIKQPINQGLSVARNTGVSKATGEYICFVDSVYKTFWDTQKIYDPDSGAYSTFRSARINFMKEAVTILFNYGKFQKAAEYYKKLEEEDGKQKEGSLEKFIMAQWAEDVRDAGVKKASEIISGLIFRSINYLVYNDHDAAVANERIARYIYKSYMSDMGDSERTKLPPFNEMKKNVLENCIRVFPPAVVEILKAKIAAEQAESAIDDVISGKRKRVK